MTKNIFVVGGVLSSLGKGIAAASIGFLLKKMGYKVGMQKLDPYLNVDPGTMSPFQHGEVFVTDDGAETDLDLGHYERFINESFGKNCNATSGQIYDRVIKKERKGAYLGKTVQVIPHVTNEIKSLINKMNEDYDIVITEIGGTVGDIESLPFLEALRQFRLEAGSENCIFVFLTYVPFVKAAGELKTKPTQHSSYKLREIGIQPDILLARSELPFDREIFKKIAMFTNVPESHVGNAIDVKCIYEVPLTFHKDKIDSKICNLLNIEEKKVDLADWRNMINNILHPEKEVKVAVCGKYVDHQDAYKSIDTALEHAGAENKTKVNISWIDSELLYENNEIDKKLKDVDAILIPGGFGVRGIKGKIEIAKYARENKIPFFGICLGMQIAVIEYARNILNLKDAQSTEFDERTKNPVIHLMEDQKYLDLMGGSMRLGAYPCSLKEDSLLAKIYENREISERHRHRYEFNNDYRKDLEANGMTISGTSLDNLLVETIEIPDHPFYVAVQYHPEFKSRPNNVHPIFNHFIKAALKKNNS